MEHLALPYGARLDSQERVPHIAKTYDGASFLEYPEQSEFKQLYSIFLVDGRPAPNLLPENCDHLLVHLDVFIQTWCFFGLLHEILGDHAPKERFLDVEKDYPHRPILSTAQLPAVISEWSHAVHDGSRDKQALCEHYMACIDTVYHFLDAISRPWVKSDLLVLQTTALLAESLEMVVQYVCGTPGAQSAKTQVWQTFRKPFGYLQAMLQRGWSQQTIDLLQMTGLQGLSTYFYLAKLPLEHHGRRGSSVLEPHATGSKVAGLSPLRHECEPQNCPEMTIDHEELHELLSTGTFALLDLTGFSSGAGSIIKLVPFTTSAQYIAISHVWSDGLGNERGNSLFFCQLEYIVRIAKQIQQHDDEQDLPLLIWIDTLCCPATDISAKELCLSRMQAIYENAAHVLIISSALKFSKAQLLDHLEIAIRLLSSTWMTRLWTLQEGALAAKLWVSMQDSPVDLDQVEESLRQIPSVTPLYRANSTACLWSLRALRRLISVERNKGKIPTFDALRRALIGRVVTEAADEPLCIATCLGLKQASLVKSKYEDRMPELWKQVALKEQRIPKKVVFFGGPRVPSPGYRWSPLSLLNQWDQTLSIKGGQDTAISIEEGLHATFPACTISRALSLSSTERDEIDTMLQRSFRGLPKPYTDHFTSYSPSLPVPFRHHTHGWFQLTDVPHKAGGTTIRHILRTYTGSLTITLSQSFDDFEREAHRGQIACLVGEIDHTNDGVNFLKPLVSGRVGRRDGSDQIVYETGIKALMDVERTAARNLDPGSVQPDRPALVSRSENAYKQSLWKASRQHVLESKLSEHGITEGSVFASAFLTLADECCTVQEDIDNMQKWCIT